MGLPCFAKRQSRTYQVIVSQEKKQHQMSPVTVCLAGLKPEVTKENMVRVSQIADACEESHRSGKPVTLDWESPAEQPIATVATDK